MFFDLRIKLLKQNMQVVMTYKSNTTVISLRQIINKNKASGDDPPRSAENQ